MATFPDRLRVIALESRSGLPVRDVALGLRLFAPRKNNYVVGPFMTDNQGRVDFTRADCEFSIRAAQELFLMDYSGDLHECGSVFRIELWRPESIEQMLRNYAEAPAFWGSAFQTPQKYFESLSRHRNREFRPAAISMRDTDAVHQPFVELPLQSH